VNLEKKICVCMFCQLLQLGSARTQVVQFFQVRRSSAASDAPAAARTGPCGQRLFSPAKTKGVQILKWRQMRAFSHSELYVSNCVAGTR
jgi:hypothetical protein